MSSFDIALQNLKNELINEVCVKQYFYYKNVIDNDKKLKTLDNEIRIHQKKMCQNKNNDQIYQQEKDKYEQLRKELDENPVYINYLVAKDEVLSLLADIKQVLG